VSGPRRRKPAAKRPARRKAVSTRDFWGHAPGPDDEPAPIRPGAHPTALVESLGPLPFPGGDVAQHYFEVVYDRAAALAVALATSADLLDDDDEGDDEPG